MKRSLRKMISVGMLCVVALVVLLLSGLTTPRDISAAPPAQSSFTLDGMTIVVNSEFLPSKGFITSRPGDSNQVATSTQWKPFRELSFLAVPFGTKPGVEIVPVARANGVAGYVSALRKYWQSSGAMIESGPTAVLFGQAIAGQVMHTNLILSDGQKKPALLIEWVVEAGQRLWIVRATQEITSDASQQDLDSLINQMRGMSSSSDSLQAPTSIKPDSSSSPNLPHNRESANDLSFPSWWNGQDCDHDRYYNGSGGWNSFRLGATFQGMPACGPRPIAGGPDVLVQFFAGAWGEYEWECVELVMRYMYLAFGISPYGANGKDVVWNYAGGILQKISNGTANSAPQPGDVLSYGSNTTYGHTSVVMSSSVDGSGNGSITVVEQNNSSGGSITMSVSNWTVNGNPYSVSGWLHKPGGGSGGPAGYTYCAKENERCNFSGTKDVAYGANGSFKYKDNISGGIDCNNSTFGDPISGVGKACYTKDSGGTVDACPKPNLRDPANNYETGSRTITFRWDSVGCGEGYAIRIRTDTNMDAGGEVLGEDVYNTEATYTLDPKWNDRDLYWSVSARKVTSNGVKVNWAEPRKFRVSAAACPAPSLSEPANGFVQTNGRTVTFRWSNANCGTGYAIRIRTVPDMNAGGETVVGEDVYNTEATYTFDPRWDNRDLYWSVTARKILSDGVQVNWATSRHLKIQPAPQKPDLRPATLSGYPAPLVPSSIQGTHQTNTLFADARTFIDWHFINSGNATAPGGFYVDVYVDNQRLTHYQQPDFGAGQTGGFDDWAETISQPGVHTLKIVTDPENAVQESDENNNVWTQQFTWVAISGWKGEYYKNSTLDSNPWLTRDDAKLDFAWADNAPDPSIPADNFSARWTRTVAFDGTTYRFYIQHDDGARLFVDGNKVFENWCSNCSIEETVDVPLTAGNHSVIMEMYENGGWASARLRWENIIPCYTLTKNVNPGGGGNVNASPAPNCSNGTQYKSGTVVTLTATANNGNTFLNWSGAAGGTSNPTTVTMNAAKNVTANFAACYTLTKTVNPAGSGGISANPAPNCNNGTQYKSGTAVTLTATANSGYVFENWSGAVSGTSNPTTVTMNAAKNVTANLHAASVTFAGVETTDGPGNPKTKFNVGEILGMRLYVDNNTASSAKITLSWEVFDPYGNKVSALSYDDWQTTVERGSWWWGIGPTIPESAYGGTYTFRGKMVYNGQTSTDETAFQVIAPSSVYVDRVWTTDQSGRAKKNFMRQEKVQYHAGIRNTGTTPCVVNAVWQAKAGTTKLWSWSGTQTIQPGGWDVWFTKKIRATAPYTRYTLKVTTNCNGQVSSASKKFSVVAGTLASDNDMNDDKGPIIQPLVLDLPNPIPFSPVGPFLRGQ